MGMKITLEQNAVAVTECADAINDRFSGSGINADIIQHSNAKKYSFVRVTTPPQHWQALAKWMKFEVGVNYCSMVTGCLLYTSPSPRDRVRSRMPSSA